MGERQFDFMSFRQFLDEHKLMGSRCRGCGALFVPPRPLCPSCYSQDMGWEEMQGFGKLMAFTTVHIAPTAMIDAGYCRDNPYCTGIVQLAEGPSISAQILGVDPAQPEQVRIGTPLRVAFVERADGEKRRTYLVFEQ